jgi:hypothetical protein
MLRGELGSTSEGQSELRSSELILPGNEAILPGNEAILPNLRASEASIFFQGMKGERSELYSYTPMIVTSEASLLHSYRT